MDCKVWSSSMSLGIRFSPSRNYWYISQIRTQLDGQETPSLTQQFLKGTLKHETVMEYSDMVLCVN